MKKKSIKKKKIKRDCWNLDMAFLIWLQERLPVYLKDAGKILDLKFYKFNIDGIEMTQEDCIKEMIQILSYLLSPEVNDWSKEYQEKETRLLKIWSEVFPAMWW